MKARMRALAEIIYHLGGPDALIDNHLELTSSAQTHRLVIRRTPDTGTYRPVVEVAHYPVRRFGTASPDPAVELILPKDWEGGDWEAMSSTNRLGHREVARTRNTAALIDSDADREIADLASELDRDVIAPTYLSMVRDPVAAAV